MQLKEQETEGVNKAEVPEALHSQDTWEPAASAKIPAEEKSEAKRMRHGLISH